MCRRVSTIRAGFYLCVVPFLFVQLWFAAIKLKDGQPGTVISRIQHATIKLPAVLFCSDGTRRNVARQENDTLVSLFERTKQYKMIVKHALYRDDRLNWHNLLNETTLRGTFGISFEEAWEDVYAFLPIPKILIKCWILRQFLDVLPSLTGQVVLGIDSRPFFSFHEEHQFVWPFSELLGNMPYLAGMTAPANSMDRIRVEQKFTTRLNSGGDNRCSEDNAEKMQPCLQEYIQRTLSCTLPWVKGTDNGMRRVCDTREDLEAYTRIVNRVLSTMSHLRDVTKETGCQTNCRTVEYSAKRINLDRNTTPDSPYYYFSLAMPQTSTVEEKEVLTYDGNNFIADVGGLLGLLLGVSVMDLAALVEGLAAKAKRSKKQRIKDI